jgi:hypothetical protein
MSKIKKREENLTERFERLHHTYDDGPKPKHYDDKSIVDQDKWRSMSGLEKKTPVVKSNRPKPFRNDDPSSYPVNQKKKMNSWEAMMELAKNPKNRDDRLQAGEMRKTIYKNYRDPVMREHLGDDELKLIGKHKSQLAPKVIAKPAYVAPIPPAPTEPEVPIEEQIKKFADAEKQKKISNLRNTVGTGGIAEVYYKRFI